MSASRRDVTLDVLKGLGCLLMVLAHSRVVLKVDDVFTYIGGLAPILFYTVTGVTATFQAAKYTFRSIFWPYLFLLLIGYSFNALNYYNFLHDMDYNIVQTIAFSAVVVYLLERFAHPRLWVYLLLVALTFAIKSLVLWYPPTREVPFLTGTILPLGYFPIIPWIALFFLGVFAYRVANSYNLALALALTVTYFALQFAGVDLQPLDKWGVSLGYFLVCCISTLAVFYLVRQIAWFQSESGKGLVLFWGRNSLLFLYIHVALINTAAYFKWFKRVDWLPSVPYVFWIGVLIVTTLLIWGLLRVVKIDLPARPFDSLPIWIGMAVLTFAVPVLAERVEWIFAAEITLGILLSLYYSNLSTIFKHRHDAPAL